ncbi:MAG TPA: UDP-N-acetylmuramoyl-L-alanine--D-glutamate ligase [Gammaproteobacteria bacterium]|nr:UDP-N-acetylmuramoyl-L-alanine--D-glutamate ligase [Gammaproteobacteria bacterium]
MTRATSRGEQGLEVGAGRRTLVVGLGDTGLSVARYLARHGEPVLVVDSRPRPPGLDALRAACPAVPIVLESLDPRWLEGAGRVALSPGLGLDLPLVTEARRRGLEIVGDIELFARAATAPVLAVTGSNGKSTAVTLAARMLAAAGYDAPAGGNLGPPALELLEPEKPLGRPDFYVLEISSFQMETTESLRPRAAAVLNVSADHLDRHGCVERYAALKAKLLEAAEAAVFNLDDPLVREMAFDCARPVPFSVRTPLERGYSIVTRNGRRWLARDGRPLLAADELSLSGTHNEANALAALALVAAASPELDEAFARAKPTLASISAAGRGADAATDSAGAPKLDGLLTALMTFEGLPHRCRRVAVRAGVLYIDDSKGTNVGASIAAIEGLAGPLVLIAGGIGKGADFAPLAESARGKVKAAVLIGRAAAELEQALAGVCRTQRAADMPSAVQAAAALAQSGDTVLLSPACASQDQFRDYRHRGEIFAAAVEALPA